MRGKMGEGVVPEFLGFTGNARLTAPSALGFQEVPWLLR